MSPPTPEEEDATLARLTGTFTETKPTGDLERNMLRLLLVKKARDADIPWTVIGASLGVSGKEAKASMRRLAAATQRELLATRNREAGLAPLRRGRPRTPRRGAVPKARAIPVDASRPIVNDKPVTSGVVKTTLSEGAR